MKTFILRGAPINRLLDSELKTLGRLHDSKCAVKAMETVKNKYTGLYFNGQVRKERVEKQGNNSCLCF